MRYAAADIVREMVGRHLKDHAAESKGLTIADVDLSGSQSLADKKACIRFVQRRIVEAMWRKRLH